MPDTTVEQVSESIADDYDKCDECVHSRTPYSNNSACKTCDGTDNFKPMK